MIVIGVGVLLVAVADVLIGVLREAERVERAEEQRRDEAGEQREGAGSLAPDVVPRVAHDA